MREKTYKYLGIIRETCFPLLNKQGPSLRVV